MFKPKVQSIPLDKYFEVKRAEYITLQLIPTKSIKNNSTDSIVSLINKLFIRVDKLVKTENKKLIVNTYVKASYYIHITKDEVQFYFIIHKIHLMKFRTKFSETWKNIEIKEVDSIPIDVNTCTKYQLNYTQDDVLSLNVDKRSNDLLNANMSVLDILEDGDTVGIFYNFIPTGQRENLFFRKIYKDNIKKFEEGYNLKKNKNILDLGIMAIKFLFGYIDNFLGSLQKEKSNSELFILMPKQISTSTKRKATKELCKTQTVVVAKSNDSKKEKELVTSLANSFKAISDDNELIAREIKGDIDIYRPVLQEAQVNRTTVEECQNFISLPGRELIEQHKMIQHNKILERKVQKCLEDGEIRIGTVKCKDTVQDAYYSTDNQISRLGRVLLGSMGAGKSYYMANMAKDAIKAGRGLIVIDIIDKCQLSDAIKKVTPEDKLVEIDCSNPNQLQSFSYNELKITEDMDIYTKVSIAMQKAQQIQVLLDAINDDNSKLSPRMLRYLYAAATVVFYKNSNASLKNVIDILTNPSKRMALLENIDEEAKGILLDEIDDLLDLNKENKCKIENYDSKIDGIVDRISWLKTNMFTKLAFTKSSDENINFIDAINDNKVILIKIPEKVFNSGMIRNVLSCYYLSKVWLAKQLGATESKTELFFDEIHQSYNYQVLMEKILVECRKFNLIPTLAMHYLGQCTTKCKNSILASGSSFLLIAGCDVKAFEELTAHFEKNGYSQEDLVELERYHALCLIKNEEENYSSFVAKLPA